MSTTQRMTNLQNGLKGSLCEITRTLSSAEQFVDEAGMLLAKQVVQIWSVFVHVLYYCAHETYETCICTAACTVHTRHAHAQKKVDTHTHWHKHTHAYIVFGSRNGGSDASDRQGFFQVRRRWQWLSWQVRVCDSMPLQVRVILRFQQISH